MARRVVKTIGAPGPGGPYSQGIIARNLVFVSGQVGTNPKTGTLPDGIKAQTKQALTNVNSILDAGGSSLKDAVRMGVYLRDISDFEEMNSVYRTFFASNPPARTTIQAVLAGKFLVEIDCIAQSRR